MKRRKKRAAVPLPLMMAETALSSWETIGHRTWMMAQGRCSPAEYQRMVVEKAQAAQLSAAALARRGGTDAVAAALTPWHRRATANAKRLRKKR